MASSSEFFHYARLSSLRPEQLELWNKRNLSQRIVDPRILPGKLRFGSS
jgi:hypothetical protein